MKPKSNLKKILSLFLSIILIITMIPMVAFAKMTTADVSEKGLFLNRDKVKLIEGTTFNLKATIGGQNVIAYWSSSDENVVSVNNGKLTAISAGTSVITAISSDGKYSAMCDVMVEALPDTIAVSGSCGKNVRWVLSRGNQAVLMIYGNGAMYNYELDSHWESTAPWFDFNIDEVIIYDGVTSIGDYAFYWLESLKKVSIPTGVKKIGKSAFEYCHTINEIILPEGLESIGESAFENCRRVKNINLPIGLVSIGAVAFDSCVSLTELIIPETVTEIGDYVFSNCLSLEKITLPSNMTKIGKAMFDGCLSLNSIRMPEGITIIDEGAFSNCRALTEVVIPENVTTIGDHAFENCELLKKVSLPKNLRTISDSAFIHCIALKDITIPNSVETIGKGAFRDCLSLEKMVLPNSVTTVGNGAFQGCTSLKEMVLPNSVTTVEISAFKDCTSLEIITLPSQLTVINAYLFQGCTSLSKIDIPEGVTSIQGYAFDGCSSLSKVNIPNGVTTIDSYAFQNCSSLANITIPKRVEAIKSKTFYGCTSLSEVTISDGVTSIGSSAFYGCTSLSKVKFPQTLITIGEAAFYNCEQLETINLPKGLTSIANKAFYSCDALKEVWLPEGLTSVGSLAFDFCNSIEKVHINSIADWLNIKFNDMNSNPCGNKNAPLYLDNAPVTKVLIPSTIHSIPHYAFYGCISIKEAILPSNITSIDWSAFNYCTSLEKVTIPDSVTTISGHAFDECTSLTHIIYYGHDLNWENLSIEENNTALSNATRYNIEFEQETYTYSGHVITPKITITCEGNVLTKGLDYTLSYDNNLNPGNAYINVSFKGLYRDVGMVTIPFVINAIDASAAVLSEIDDYTYTGLPCEPSFMITLGNHKMVEGKDYTYEYIDNINVGKAEIKISFKGNYSGTISTYFDIEPIDVSNAKISKIADQIHTGSPLTPPITITFNGKKLIAGTDYTVTYADNTRVGIGKAFIVFKGNYKSASILRTTFAITHDYKTKIVAATVNSNGSQKKVCSTCGNVKSIKTIPKVSSIKLSATEYTYNGSKKTPTVTVKNSKGNKLVEGEAYKLTYSSSSRLAIGRYSVKVTFKGDYSGSKTLYFTIGPKNPSTVKAILYGYDDIKVSWSKVSGATGYKVYYKKSTAGTWSSKITTGSYVKLPNLSDGVKYNIKVVTYKTKNGYKCYNAGKSTSIYTLKKVTAVKVARSGTKVKVSWANISGETGYQISKSTKKTGTNIVATYKTTSGKYKTISAAKGKTYYYKVRAYKVVDGKRIYGPWSTTVNYVRR